VCGPGGERTLRTFLTSAMWTLRRALRITLMPGPVHEAKTNLERWLSSSLPMVKRM